MYFDKMYKGGFKYIVVIMHCDVTVTLLIGVVVMKIDMLSSVSTDTVRFKK